MKIGLDKHRTSEVGTRQVGKNKVGLIELGISFNDISLGNYLLCK